MSETQACNGTTGAPPPVSRDAYSLPSFSLAAPCGLRACLLTRDRTQAHGSERVEPRPGTARRPALPDSPGRKGLQGRRREGHRGRMGKPAPERAPQRAGESAGHSHSRPSTACGTTSRERRTPSHEAEHRPGAAVHADTQPEGCAQARACGSTQHATAGAAGAARPLAPRLARGQGAWWRQPGGPDVWDPGHVHVWGLRLKALSD